MENDQRAYISIVTDEILVIASRSGNCGYNALACAMKRNQVQQRAIYCRKIFSTYLRMNGVESELIDLLQGRIPKSVFARHYFRPDFNKEMERIRKLVGKLYKEIVDR